MAEKVRVRKNSSITFATSKAAADSAVVFDQALEIEDEFNSLYEVGQDGVVLLAPPFPPHVLAHLCTRNNILQQCVQAMEVNVDGTGFTIEPIDQTKPKPKKPAPFQPAAPAAAPAATPAASDPSKVQKDDDPSPDKKRAEEFFKEPFPGQSMITIRRKLRVDLEQTGNAYLEILRNLDGELVFIRHVDAVTMRMVKLDAPVPVEKTLKRDGKDFTASVLMRERRFMQMVGTKKTYFKEFGASRDIDRLTGKWIDPKKTVVTATGSNKGKVPQTQFGNEILHFVVDRDTKTPYGVPRWINNLPSVLGSRKAEEFNLEFFDAGGVPPAIILIAGGALTTTVREQLIAHLAGKGRAKHRAAVVEIQSAEGGLDKPGARVDVKVERFGDSRQNDSMFQKYDENTEEHVRVAFRLPPLFVGRSSDYSFATAMTSYMIAEEQVFAPERMEFDEIINSTLMKELGVADYKYVSKPMTLKNVEVQLEGVALVKDVIDGQERVDAVNDITGLQLQYSEGAEQQTRMDSAKNNPFGFGKGGDPSSGAGDTAPLGSHALGGVSLQPQKQLSQKAESFTPNDIVLLVNKWAIAAGLDEGEMSEDERKLVLGYVNALKGANRSLFDRVLATKSFANAAIDFEGLAELAGTCAHLTRH